MAILAISVPHQTARLFSDIDVPGKREAVSSMHVTLVYIGSDVPIDVLAEAVKATYAVTSKTEPFTVRATRVMSFPVNPDDEDGHPVVARLDSDALHAFRSNLARSLDEAGVEFNKKFPDYKPHVTLAYAPEPVEEFRIPAIEWGAHEIVLWGSDEGDGRLMVTFPFSFGAPETDSRTAAIARRVSHRFRISVAARALSATRC